MVKGREEKAKSLMGAPVHENSGADCCSGPGAGGASVSVADTELAEGDN